LLRNVTASGFDERKRQVDANRGSLTVPAALLAVRRNRG
jgi:hypothetical protein